MDGGETKKRLATPPIEKPISCVDITTIHWSVSISKQSVLVSYMLVGKEHTYEIIVLVIVNSLDSNDVGLQSNEEVIPCHYSARAEVHTAYAEPEPTDAMI